MSPFEVLPSGVEPDSRALQARARPDELEQDEGRALAQHSSPTLPLRGNGSLSHWFGQTSKIFDEPVRAHDENRTRRTSRDGRRTPPGVLVGKQHWVADRTRTDIFLIHSQVR